MSIVVPLVLAALLLVLLRRFLLRRRRMRRGLPVRGPYHLPRWVRELRVPWRGLWRLLRGRHQP